MLHIVAWGLLLVVLPHHYAVGRQVFGVGLGVTAYTLGVRHAFDADHIAVIDNTTRTLLAAGKRPLSAGFWFAIGHSTVVVALAALVALGTRLAGTVLDGGSGTHRTLSIVGASVSGLSSTRSGCSTWPRWSESCGRSGARGRAGWQATR